MSFRDLLDMAKRNLLARKLRTGLTLLGVVIGCVSIILMISFGYGITENNRRMMEGFGDVKNIQVMENSMEPGGKSKKTPKKITDRSIQDFKQIPHVIDVTPVYTANLSAKYRKYTGDYLSVTAMNKETYATLDWRADKGSLFHGKGEGQMIFGSDMADAFYDPMSPETDTSEDDDVPLFDAAGKTMSVSSSDMPNFGFGPPAETPSGNDKTTTLKVTGVLKKTKKSQYDNGAFMTIEGYKKLAETLDLPAPERGTYSTVQVRIDDTEYAEDVTDAIKDLGYEPSGLLEAIKSMNRGMAIVNAIFAGIGSISFIVAAIGIANTMIMSIYERTKEIGVMKVIGASIQDIQKLFLTEAALIGFIGGVIGVITSLLLSGAFNIIGNRFAQSQGAEEAIQLSYIPLWLIFVALLFSTMVGVAAGYFPAKRAMNLSALDAIRSD